MRLTKLVLLSSLFLLFYVGFVVFWKRPPCPDCNVLVIAVDALQASHVSALGYRRITTPSIDALARKGALFTNAISAAPWTVPSYMSVFTGLFPSEHGVVNKFTEFSPAKKTITHLDRVAPGTETIAQMFQSNGYATAGFTGDAGVSAQFGYNKGFDTYIDGPTFGTFSTSTTNALNWLKKNLNKKFFLFVHGYDTHGQATPSAQPSFADSSYSGSYSGAPKEQRTLRERGLGGEQLNLTQEDQQFWNNVYDSKIKDADYRVGRFLEEFHKLTSNRKTIIVLFSDHGTELYEHDRFDHGHTLYDELVHVPLVITIPSVRQSSKVNSQVSTIDIPQTLLDLTGIKASKRFLAQQRGTSLVPALTGGKIVQRDVYIETDYRDYTHKRGIRTSDGWKYILTLESGERELYNLNKDPHEKINLLSSQPKKAYQLDMQVKKHLQTMGVDPFKKWETGCLPVYGDQCIQ